MERRFRTHDKLVSTKPFPPPLKIFGLDKGSSNSCETGEYFCFLADKKANIKRFKKGTRETKKSLSFGTN